jgi:hypothetical protein
MRLFSKNYTIYLGILASVIIIPKVRLTSDYTFGMDDFISIGFFVSALIFSVNEKDRSFRVVSKYFYVILITGFLSHIYGNYIFMSTFSIPGEMLQYIKRFVFFVLAYKFTLRFQSYNGINRVIAIIIIVYSLSLLVGLLQLLGVKEFAEIYSRSDKQLAVALRYGNDFKMIGTAGMTTSWGVLCAYFYLFFASLLLVYNKHKRYGYIVLVLVSILFSFNTVSRSAFLCVTFVSIYLLKTYIFDRKHLTIDLKKSDPVMRILSIVILAPLLLVGIFTMVGDSKLSDISSRFEKSTPGIGEQHYEDNDRYVEVSSAIETLNAHPSGYILGLGRLFSARYTEHIEVEPFYILSVYGAIGLIIRMLMLYRIYQMSKSIFRDSSTRALKLFSIIVKIATPMFFLASLGLAFWHESVSGTPYWVIVGILFALRVSEASLDSTNSLPTSKRLAAGQYIA